MSKKRKYALSAWSGLADKRPPREDNNTWKTLIDSRQGYTYLARVLARILDLLRRKGSVSHSRPGGLSPYQKMHWTIFAEEISNSYQAIVNRQGKPSSQI